MTAKLTIRDGGPCARHPCDDCGTCRGGRCCRRDNPEYQLPKLGDWDGPIYVPLGETRSSDGVLLECHACGEAFKSVGQHAWRSHDLTSSEYRAIFGISRRMSLAGPDYYARRAELTREQVREGRRPVLDASALTTEQRSANQTRADERRRALGLPPPSASATRERMRRPGAVADLVAKRGQRFLTAEDRAEIVQRGLSGETARDLARAYLVSPSLIRQIVRDARKEIDRDA